MNYSKFIALIVIILSVSCEQNQTKSFSLTGTTSNIPDSTLVFFHNLFNGKSIDSAIVLDNKFQFETKFEKYPNWVMMHTLGEQDFTEVWVENSPMIFDASDSNFSDGKIFGSNSQKVANEYDNIDWFSKQSDESNLLKLTFVKEHSNSIIAAKVIAFNADRWGREKSKLLYDGLSPEMKNSIFKERIGKVINSKQPTLGTKYVDFILKDTSRVNQQFSKLTGELTLLQFWASGCGYSRMDNLYLKEAHRLFSKKGFEIVGVSIDKDKSQWKNAIINDSLSWINLSSLKGENGEVKQAYGIFSTPNNFLFDSNGVLIARSIEGENLVEEIEDYFSNKN
ncbi:peroxiredoxin [Gillisia mitskevichiae]|uniref:Peroxiredoxin n=1 Tax=Gillisia mitskevichiae TaxID=270921 RepID=A0A495NXE7_9FLAO|nr:TlpA disulfide reductase family protein [Gillisia mitskevichiae]RKS42536.1 peroxiredoxin [Gillisia mitskevichiae]